jgi:hypothetical protein
MVLQQNPGMFQPRYTGATKTSLNHLPQAGYPIRHGRLGFFLIQDSLWFSSRDVLTLDLLESSRESPRLGKGGQSSLNFFPTASFFSQEGGDVRGHRPKHG